MEMTPCGLPLDCKSRILRDTHLGWRFGLPPADKKQVALVQEKMSGEDFWKWLPAFVELIGV